MTPVWQPQGRNRVIGMHQSSDLSGRRDCPTSPSSDAVPPGYGVLESGRSRGLQRARQALKASPFYGLRELEVEETDSGLVISGKVSTFYQKQQAQEVVRAVAEGIRVVNSVQVGER